MMIVTDWVGCVYLIGPTCLFLACLFMLGGMAEGQGGKKRDSIYSKKILEYKRSTSGVQAEYKWSTVECKRSTAEYKRSTSEVQVKYH